MGRPDDLGSKTWTEFKKDQYQYTFQPSFPSTSTARTTFYAREADNEAKFNRLFRLQHGRGHTFEGWDGQRVRPENEFTYRRASVILSQADISGWVRERTLAKVLQENLNGFSRHYKGIDGAAIGLASLFRYECVEEAKDSYLVDVAEEILGIDGKQLIEYVWGKYR